jgi:hypothetical protein
VAFGKGSRATDERPAAGVSQPKMGAWAAAVRNERAMATQAVAQEQVQHAALDADASNAPDLESSTEQTAAGPVAAVQASSSSANSGDTASRGRGDNESDGSTLAAAASQENVAIPRSLSLQSPVAESPPPTARWLDAAALVIAEACPSAADLDVLPQHVLGLGLDDLSASQLEALETIHRSALARISDARVRLAAARAEASAAERARLRDEIAAVAAAMGRGGGTSSGPGGPPGGDNV